MSKHILKFSKPINTILSSSNLFPKTLLSRQHRNFSQKYDQLDFAFHVNGYFETFDKRIIKHQNLLNLPLALIGNKTALKPDSLRNTLFQAITCTLGSEYAPVTKTSTGIYIFDQKYFNAIQECVVKRAENTYGKDSDKIPLFKECAKIDLDLIQSKIKQWNIETENKNTLNNKNSLDLNRIRNKYYETTKPEASKPIAKKTESKEHDKNTNMIDTMEAFKTAVAQQILSVSPYPVIGKNGTKKAYSLQFFEGTALHDCLEKNTEEIMEYLEKELKVEKNTNQDGTKNYEFFVPITIGNQIINKIAGNKSNKNSNEKINERLDIIDASEIIAEELDLK